MGGGDVFGLEGTSFGCGETSFGWRAVHRGEPPHSADPLLHFSKMEIVRRKMDHLGGGDVLACTGGAGGALP